MALDPKLRNVGLVAGTAISTALATVTWMSSHSVDVYALAAQVNEVVVQITKLVTMIGTIYAAIVAFRTGTPRGIAEDVKTVAKQENSPLKGVITNDNSEGRSIAAAPGPVEIAGTANAEMLAKP